MSDDDLRALERRFQETRALDDEVRLLGALARLGKLAPHALPLAASLGHAAARALVPDAPAVPFLDLPPIPGPGERFLPDRRLDVPAGDRWVELVAASPLEVGARVLLAAARVTEPRFVALVPGAAGFARRAIERVEAWLACPCDEHLAAAGRGDPEDPAREELRVGGPYARANTLADEAFWSYKEGVSERLAAYGAVGSPSTLLGCARLPGKYGPNLTRRVLGTGLNKAAFVVGREVVREALGAVAALWLRVS